MSGAIQTKTIDIGLVSPRGLLATIKNNSNFCKGCLIGTRGTSDDSAAWMLLDTFNRVKAIPSPQQLWKDDKVSLIIDAKGEATFQITRGEHQHVIYKASTQASRLQRYVNLNVQSESFNIPSLQETIRSQPGSEGKSHLVLAGDNLTKICASLISSDKAAQLGAYLDKQGVPCIQGHTFRYDDQKRKIYVMSPSGAYLRGVSVAKILGEAASTRSAVTPPPAATPAAPSVPATATAAPSAPTATTPTITLEALSQDIQGAVAETRELLTKVDEFLKESGPQIDIYDSESDTLLIKAAKKNFTETVKKLLDANADINKADTSSTTPLMWAVAKGKVETVRLLVKFGANRNLEDNKGKTAMELAESLLTDKKDDTTQRKLKDIVGYLRWGDGNGSAYGVRMDMLNWLVDKREDRVNNKLDTLTKLKDLREILADAKQKLNERTGWYGFRKRFDFKLELLGMNLLDWNTSETKLIEKIQTRIREVEDEQRVAKAQFLMADKLPNNTGDLIKQIEKYVQRKLQPAEKTLVQEGLSKILALTDNREKQSYWDSTVIPMIDSWASS
jgi:hypothetical protein